MATADAGTATDASRACPIHSSARAVTDGERLPPPPLFRCTTYDNDHYLSDDGTPSNAARAG